jgi:hypothetical protein
VLQQNSYSSVSRADLKAKIQTANNTVVSRLQKGEIILEDIVPAREVIPFLGGGKKAFLHAGPPVSWDRMCNSMKGAAAGMAIMEGWAKDVDGALALMKNGEVTWASNNEHNSVGPMSGIITPSFPVYVVHNKAFGNRSFSRPADLHQQFGNYHHLDAVRKWRDVIGPVFRQGLKARGPIDLYPILQQSLEFGDELHNRVNAFTNLLAAQLFIGMNEGGVPKETQRQALEFVYNDMNGSRLTLGLAMACAQAILNPACGVEYSTILSCMSRNGTDWGIRLCSTHPEWYTAAAPTCHKYFIFPGFTRADFGLDMGDSVITETAGWGAFLMGNSLALAHNVGCTPQEAFAFQESNSKYCIATNNRLKVPSFAFGPAPLGIDLRPVIAKNEVFLINTGIAHKEMGHSVVARGLLLPPMDAFQKAAQAWCKKYNVSIADFVGTL